MAKITAKQYLNRIRILDGEIDRLERQRQNLRAMLYGTTSPANMSDRIQSQSVQDKWYQLIAKVDAKERAMVSKIDKLVDMKEKVSREIESISLQNKASERNIKDVLHYHYIIGMPLDKVAAQMNYTYRWVCKLHGRALLIFDQQIMKGKKSSY